MRINTQEQFNTNIKFCQGNQSFILFPDYGFKSDPITNLISNMVDNFDLSFLYNKYADKRYSGGRPHYDQKQMLIIILLSRLENLSTREIVEKIKYDERYRMIARDFKAVPSYRTIAYFINKLVGHEEFLLAEQIKYISKFYNLDISVLYVDGSVIIANNNKYNVHYKNKIEKKIELLTIKLNELKALPYNEEEAEKLEKKLAIETKILEFVLKNRKNCGKNDEEAIKIMDKSNKSIVGYNCQVASENNYGFSISAKTYSVQTDIMTFVDFVELLTQTNNIETIVADAGYGSEETYAYLNKKNIKALIKNNMAKKVESDKFTQLDFELKNDNQIVCPNGRILELKTNRNYQKESKYKIVRSTYESSDCSGCKFSDKCLKEGMTNKSISISITNYKCTSIVYNDLRSEEGIRLYKKRAWIAEGVFATIKNKTNYSRTYRKGVAKVNLEIVLQIMAANIIKFHNLENSKLSNGKIKKIRYKKDIFTYDEITLF